ncbi:MAG: gamma-glutamyltransferase, partial [Chloroflexi bacterium]|nr:gamma-glutamyltransferase [Chloroflexota bacterium]
AATIQAARAAGLERVPLRGAWSITVPGAIASWGDAHKRFGRLAWADLLAPAIELAESFPASPAWVGAVESGARAYGVDSDWAQAFRSLGRAWRLGEVVRLPALAKTLGRIAAEGPEEAYTGGVGRSSAAYLEAQGSPIRGSDLAEHHSDWVEPIRTEYRGVTATSHPPNSCGPIALELLNVLALEPAPARESFTAQGVTDADWVHRGLEAARLTLADRDAFLTDALAMAPDGLAILLSRERAQELAGRIDPDRVTAPPASPLPRGGGTIYLATADRWGGCVSLIESNYAGFGSGLVDPATGIGFQNRGAFFTLDPSHANALAPGKRTMHTLTPGMLFRDGRPWVVHGSMGGEIQPQVYAQFVSALVDGELDIAAALAAPRWAADVEEHYGAPVISVLESRYARAVADELEVRGHRLRWAEPFDSGLGHAHAIELVRGPDGGIESFGAATDPRSEGQPLAW